MTRFFFGIAGIPPQIFEDVERENKAYAQQAKFCIDQMPHNASYKARNVEFFVKSFYEFASKEKHDSCSETAFAIVYVTRDDESTKFFVESFFPHMLLIPVQWQLDLSQGPQGVRASKNRLIPLLAQATSRARHALRALEDELVSRASNTPFLLPIKNFDSKRLNAILSMFHSDLVSPHTQPTDVIGRYIKKFKHAHPPQKVGERDCFVDDSRVEFRPPGSSRHAYSRAGGQHPPECFLSGHRRLGAPYDPLFHYDCAKGNNGNLFARLHGCHEPKEMREGAPHINVAPNDNVRIKGQK